MRRAQTLSAVLAISAVAAFSRSASAGAFEGTIEMKMTSPMGTGSMRISIGKPGMRSEVRMTGRGEAFELAILVKSSNRDVAYHINDAQRTYSEFDLAHARARAPKKESHGYTVKKLGKETVAGYSCVHAQLTDSNGAEMEVWTTKEILDYETTLAAMGPGSNIDTAVQNALKSIDGDGFFVKMIHRSRGNAKPQMTMELVKAVKKAIPAATFEIPAGYEKTEGFMGAAMPPGAAEAMQEHMKSLTPEQQEMMKKAMRQQTETPASK